MVTSLSTGLMFHPAGLPPTNAATGKFVSLNSYRALRRRQSSQKLTPTSVVAIEDLKLLPRHTRREAKTTHVTKNL
jgi:hypothetical protein